MKKLLSLFFVIVVTICFMSCSNNSPEGVVKEYYAAIEAKDYDKAMECLYFKKELTESQKEQFKNLFIDKAQKQVDKKGGIKSFEISNTDIAEDGKSAIVSVTTTYGDGTSNSQNNKVLKVEDKWLIDSGK